MSQEKAYIFGAIFFLANKMQNAGDKLFTEITMKQWFLLISIIRSGVENPTLTEVSEIIGYSRQNVKKIGVHLENAGFVALKKDMDDGRVLRITLTEKCNLYFESRKGEENKFIENLYKGITDDEIKKMFLVMEKLENNILKLG